LHQNASWRRATTLDGFGGANPHIDKLECQFCRTAKKPFYRFWIINAGN
jgi:hypothetical protein